MGDSAGVGYKIGDKIVGVQTHIRQNGNNVLFLLAYHGFEGFKKQIDEHPGGFTTLIPQKALIHGDPWMASLKSVELTDFIQGTDYEKRGDPRPMLHNRDLESVEYFYAAGDDGEVYYYQYGELTHIFDIDEHVEVEFVFRSEE